jgi:hypothetical protein
MFLEQKATNQSISMRKPIYGVGINDAEYITTKKISSGVLRCPFYVKWVHMLERCYCEKFHAKNQSYADCAVCDEWMIFSNFKEWMVEQEWEGMSLDKDLISKGNKIYSPDKCMFVSKEVNSILSKFSGTHQPKGISFSYSRYAVQCSVDGVNSEYGRYKTREEAENRYAEVKAEAVTELSFDQSDNVARLLLKFFGIS